MHTSSQFDQDVFRIVLFRDNAAELLLEDNPHGLRLPEVAIPKHSRFALEIGAVLRSSWRLDAYHLFTLPSDISARYAALESCSCEPVPPSGMQWRPVLSAFAETFEDPADLIAIRDSTATLERYRRNELPGSFAKPGWMQELTRWVEAEAAGLGLTVSGQALQFNASPTFSLIRFETDGPAIWFKAVGAPNEREYAITLALAGPFSRYLPTVLATRPEWHGWLAMEVEGPLLHGCSHRASWESAAADLADLQILSLDQIARLLDLGARDLRTQRLEELVEPFFRVMGELMDRQTKIPPPTLSRAELHHLREQVHAVLLILNETGIPAALGHLDINPRNIVSSPKGCVFLDWAEGFVGHPFLTFEYLLEYFRRGFGQEPAQEAPLIAGYSSPWRAFAPAGNIQRAFAAAPLAAVFGYATASNAWRDAANLNDPRVASSLRSLTRRMQREANVLVERSTACPS